MQFDMGMSTSRYFPPNGTAGFALAWVNGNKRVPFPPPRTMANTSDIVLPLFCKSANVPGVAQQMLQSACRFCPDKISIKRNTDNVERIVDIFFPRGYNEEPRRKARKLCLRASCVCVQAALAAGIFVPGGM
jgi:hypothetical protein